MLGGRLKSFGGGGHLPPAPPGLNPPCTAMQIYTVYTLSKTKVFVTAKLHPASKALRIIGELVVGVAEASPNGFSNFNPAHSTLMSTRSMGVKKFGSCGSGGT